MGSHLESSVFISVREGLQHNERMWQPHSWCNRIGVERLEVFQLGGITGVKDFPGPFGRRTRPERGWW